MSAINFKQKGILNVLNYTEFKPVSWGEAEAEGYEADLLKAIAKLWQVQINFFPEDIYEGIWRLPSRRYAVVDLAMGGLTPDQDRAEQGAKFSLLTTHFKQSLLIRKEDYESKRITSYKSFKNTTMKIGVVPDTTGEAYAHEVAEKNGVADSVFAQYPNESDLLPALIDKKIDAIARGEIGNEFQASKNKNLMTIAKHDFNEGFAFSVDSSNKELLEEIDKAIRLITDNGKYTYPEWYKNPNIFNERVLKLINRESSLNGESCTSCCCSC